jgi:glycerol kinase
MGKYILSLDQGTTSSRSILFDKAGNIIAVAQKEFTQIYPKPGWVEHDPEEIWETQLYTIKEVLKKASITSDNIAGIGITNQRETTIVWDKNTGQPVYNAIVWQDRRTAGVCDDLKARNFGNLIQQKTGLVIDAYFSGTKVQWILDHVDGVRDRAKDGKIAFGTVDSWLIYKLTGGKVHVTDYSNASRTMLFNINDGEWENQLLDLMDIPRSVLPKVSSSSEVYGYTDLDCLQNPVPICGVAGDQQAALFGQMCIKEGMIKNTYGTGCFMMMNTGEKPVESKNNLLTTIAWNINGKTTYALEGSIFIGGAIVQWLRDELEFFADSAEIEPLANSVEDSGGVYLVPALTGLGAPHWDPYARGTMFGLTRGTTKAHIAKAALDSIAYQTRDVLDCMQSDAHCVLSELRVDGGASVNNYLMQFQSDLIQQNVVRPKTLETTALGAAYLAGLAVGYWNSLDEIYDLWQVDTGFEPQMELDKCNQLVKGWHEAVKRSGGWIKESGNE